MRKFMFILISIVIVSCVACDLNPYPTQTEGTVHLEGDSVTFNTYYAPGVTTHWTTSSFFCPGARIDNPGFCADAVPAKDRIPQLLEDGHVDVLVWALGLNEVLAEGWSARYQLLWTDLLAQKVPSTSCIVLVKPWVLPIANAQRPIEAMHAIRKWMDDFASAHPNVVLVDWKPILEANPQFSPEDGVHITPDSGGPQARDAMYQEGVASCD